MTGKDHSFGPVPEAGSFDEVWKEYIKEGKVRGFSIEGWFVDKMKTKQKTEQARLK